MAAKVLISCVPWLFFLLPTIIFFSCAIRFMFMSHSRSWYCFRLFCRKYKNLLQSTPEKMRLKCRRNGIVGCEKLKGPLLFTTGWDSFKTAHHIILTGKWHQIKLLKKRKSLPETDYLHCFFFTLALCYQISKCLFWRERGYSFIVCYIHAPSFS